MNGPTKQLNFNTVLNFIIIAVVGWVGTSIKDGTEKLARINERIAIIETANIGKVEQLNRIEADQVRARQEMTRYWQAVMDLQLELARVKGVTPQKP